MYFFKCYLKADLFYQAYGLQFGSSVFILVYFRLPV